MSMQRGLFRTVAVVAVVLSITGCSTMSADSVRDRVVVTLGLNSDLVRSGYKAADMLAGGLTRPLPPQSPLLVATFVNVDDLEDSSTFGRSLSDIVATRLSHHGFAVKDVRLRKGIFVRQQGGEFMLSRNAQAVGRGHSARGVVTGTYGVGKYSVYVSARIVDPADNVVVAAYDFTLPKDKNISRLLRQDADGLL